MRKGNESLLTIHPHIRRTIIFDKKTNKYSNLLKLIRSIRSEKYDYVINAQRFFTTGLITVLSGAKHTIGFDKNPLSFLFTTRLPHIIDDHGKLEKAKVNRKQFKDDSTPPLGSRGAEEEDRGNMLDNSTPPLGSWGAEEEDRGNMLDDSTPIGARGAENSTPPLGGRGAHETHRNLSLIEQITDNTIVKPRLYPSNEDYRKVEKPHPYICIAPASVWFTKQFPANKWIELINNLPKEIIIYLLGAKSDISLAEEIIKQALIQNPMLRPADTQPGATLRLPLAHPHTPAQCGAAQ
ncbi:MAG: hypothetical protein ABIQ11_12395, partial [Saprospiraceae bacterium]